MRLNGPCLFCIAGSDYQKIGSRKRWEDLVFGVSQEEEGKEVCVLFEIIDYIYMLYYL